MESSVCRCLAVLLVTQCIVFILVIDRGVCQSSPGPPTSDTPCYNSVDVRTALQRCDAIADAKKSYPFYYQHQSDTKCRLVSEKIRCHVTELLTHCDKSTALQHATLVKADEESSNGYNCSLDVNEMIDSAVNATSGSQCDYNSFFHCTSQTTAWDCAIPTFFDSFRTGQLQPSVVLSCCSAWSNYTACVDDTGCTFEDIYWHVVATDFQPYYKGLYNQTVVTMRYMCSHVEAYTTHRSCYTSTTVQTAFSRCDTIYRSKSQHPFNVNTRECSLVQSYVECYSAAVRASCNSAAAYELVKANVVYQQTWIGTQCPLAQCDDNEFFFCTPQTTVWNYDGYTTLTNLHQGLLAPSTVSLYCSLWNKYTSCVDASGCTFQDIHTLLTTQYNWDSYHAQRYTYAWETMEHTCSHLQEYSVYQPCYNASVDGFSRCDEAERLRRSFPFYHKTFSCSLRANTIGCYAKVIRGYCNETAAYFNALTFDLMQRTWVGRRDCAFDFNDVLNTSSGCDQDTFLLCTSETSIFAHLNSTVMGQLRQGRVPPTTLRHFCSIWDNFTMCANKSGCTTEHVYEMFESYVDWVWDSYYRLLYNNTFATLRHICVNLNAYESHYYSCYADASVQNGLRRCDEIANTKISYPFQYQISSCTAAHNEIRCYMSAVDKVCNSTAAYNLALNALIYHERWNRDIYGCTFDLNAILNITKTGSGGCDDDEFFACSTESRVWNYVTSTTLQDFNNGLIAGSELSHLCSAWNNFTSCVSSSGCTFNDIDQLLSTQSGGWWPSHYRQQFMDAISTAQYIC